MRRTSALLLILGSSLPAFAADLPAPAAETGIPWYRRVFLGEREKPKPPAPPVAAARPAVPPSRESVENMLKQEMDVYVQRLNAISKIRIAADDRGDAATLKKADELEANAQRIYEERVARLKSNTMAADRAALERKPTDDRPATAQRPTTTRRPLPGGTDR